MVTVNLILLKNDPIFEGETKSLSKKTMFFFPHFSLHDLNGRKQNMALEKELRLTNCTLCPFWIGWCQSMQQQDILVSAETGMKAAPEVKQVAKALLEELVAHSIWVTWRL